jgi:hypothetical protein
MGTGIVVGGDWQVNESNVLEKVERRGLSRFEHGAGIVQRE